MSAIDVTGRTCSQLQEQEGCGQVLREWKLAIGSWAGLWYSGYKATSLVLSALEFCLSL